jgi:endonuclease/exonuclease/phosphatase family metal-dependent hydrolase
MGAVDFLFPRVGQAIRSRHNALRRRNEPRRARTGHMQFTIATYNIHKGFSQLGRRMVIHEVRDRLHGLPADIVFLQEVLGVHQRHADRFNDWPAKPQHEFIAGERWQEVCYGKNCVYEHGHHGNALLSRFPIEKHENVDISAHQFESRGMLHCEIRLGSALPTLHCINVHLGLFERGRQWQIRALCERIRETVPDAEPLIVAGDFNDWRHKANRQLIAELGVDEVFEEVRGRPARTFPSVLPVFRLDRIYARGLRILDARVHYAFPAARMSDHAALAATFEVAA